MSVGAVSGTAVFPYLVAAISRQANADLQKRMFTPPSSSSTSQLSSASVSGTSGAGASAPSDFMAAVIARQLARMSDVGSSATASSNPMSASAKSALAKYTEFTLD